MIRTAFYLRDERGIAEPVYTWTSAVAVLIIAVGAIAVERLTIQLFPDWSPKAVWALAVAVSIVDLAAAVGFIAGWLWWVSKRKS